MEIIIVNALLHKKIIDIFIVEKLLIYHEIKSY